MPDRPTKKKARTNDLKISNEVLDQILENYQKLEDLFGSDGIFAHLKEPLVQRALDAELSHHLGYEKGAPRPEGHAMATIRPKPSRPTTELCRCNCRAIEKVNLNLPLSQNMCAVWPVSTTH